MGSRHQGLQAWLHLATVTVVMADFFCEQFYNNITSREPLRFIIDDNAPVGTILRSFKRPDYHLNQVSFTLGAFEFVNFDASFYSLVTKSPLYAKADQVIQIHGNCSEHIKRINHVYTIPLTILVDIIDVNDVPVFANLPANLRIKESVRVGTLLYKVGMKEGFDKREKFATTVLRITGVTAEGFPGIPVTRFFSLDLNGNVYLRQPIDYETDPRKFEITIEAEDLGEPPLSASSSLTFYIQDTDDMTPSFAHSSYSATIIGEKPINSPECKPTEPAMRAEDRDVRAKSEVHYRISSADLGTPGDWEDVFSLDRTTGRLCQLATVKRTVPDPVSGRYTFANYTFKVQGYQVDNRRKYANADLFVHVADSNKHAPSFNRKLYRASVKEYPAIQNGYHVVQVKAEDKDHGQNGAFRYRLEGPTSQYFHIDPANGSITVTQANRFDREIYQSLEFKVKATEINTVEKMESEARVVVTIEDLNDNTPEFEQYRYVFKIKDSLRPGRPVHSPSGAIEAHDRDAGDNARLRYSISAVEREQGEVAFSDFGRFTIDPDDGTLRLSGSLSDLRRRRQHPVYRLTVTATDQARDPDLRKSTSVPVIIRVSEANDYVPTIIPQRGLALVNETAALGTNVYQLQVRDRDGDEDIYLKYSIIHGNSEGHFRIGMEGRVVVNGQLDRETKEFYKLKVKISDGKHKPTTTVKIQVIDENDNRPRFSQEEFVFELTEEPSEGTLVGQVVATDADSDVAGHVTYRLKPGFGSNLFLIQPDGRLITAKKSHLLDREMNNKIRLRVIARDSGKPPLESSADVVVRIVDVNDNRPLFTTNVYHGWVYEDGSATEPQFVTMDIAINATDMDADFANRDVRYALSGEGSDVFFMDDIRADVITAEIGLLDSETQETYKLKVTATDQAGTGLSSVAQLIITVKDKNDNVPFFTSSGPFTVLPDTKKGANIGTVAAVDADVTSPNNHLIYILKEGGNGKFTVDFETGNIILVEDMDSGPLHPVYDLLIQTIDGGSPRLTNQTKVTVKVPVNRPPIITTNTSSVRVKEDIPLGSVVKVMVAYDPDTGENEVDGNIEFFLMDNEVPFEVNPQGMIRTKDYLDVEKQQNYKFELYVKDEGFPPMTSSTLVNVLIDDVNDHPPEFVNAPYRGVVVEDNVSPIYNQYVKLDTNISVIDRDITAKKGDIRFSLRGKHRDKFIIDPESGEIRVSLLGYGYIDREKNSRFKLKVRATDREGTGLSSDADVIIYVTDVNDVSPRFLQEAPRLMVTQQVEVGQVIGRLEAVDGDATKPNNLLIYTLENDPYGKFSVDSHTGEVRVLTGVFYPPRQGFYRLQVAATDMGFPPRRSEVTAEIQVNKTDFNDHKPEFYGENIFYVNEEVSVGSLIGTVSIADEDQPKDKPLSLSVHGKNGPVPFAVDSRTGEIRSTSRLDFDTGSRAITFDVVARDVGDPPRTARISVGVILHDINDHPPQFALREYHHHVSTTFPPGSIVATPLAHDDVDSGDSVYRYRMEGEDVGQYFFIDPASGIVRTTDRLSQLTDDQVQYVIIAEDIYNEQLAAEAKLIIDVHRMNLAPCCCKVPCDSTDPP